jgi:cysteine desulfurase/selenocysteine lyase
MQKMKQDFPIFVNNPNLIFLDSCASSQKPKYVIDWICKYLSHSYSNIHRWLYDIAIESEKIYFDSKKKIAEFIHAYDFKEIIYTYNSNYALNLITQTLRLNSVLSQWDVVLLSIVEHHSNIVPWLILQEEIWIQIEFVKINDDFSLNWEDFLSKYTQKVKVISCTHISNVTWQIFDLEKIWNFKRDDTLFIVDASQSFPHIEIDVQKLNCDFLFFTGHKVMADSGIWIIWWKSLLLNAYKPIFSWGWAISHVKERYFTSWSLPFKYEPWTPNITWALSLLKSLEYIENIWGYKKIAEIENTLIQYSLDKFRERSYIKLIGNMNWVNRVWVFSFYISEVHSLDIADIMAENNICIRAWQHCTEPFMDYLWIPSTARMSLYIYNTFDDIDRFFTVLDNHFN